MLALQFGCPLDVIAHALKRDGEGIAASPIGQALDLVSMSQKPAPLAKPIEIGKFWKNRRRDTAIVVSLSPTKATTSSMSGSISLANDGCMRPTTKGLAMVVRRLPEFSRVLRLALERARALDLLPDEGAE